MQKAYVAWLSTKLSVLLFAIMLFISFFLFYTFQSNFQSLDTLHKTTENLARTIDSVCASPFPIETKFTLQDISQLETRKKGDLYYVTLVKDYNATKSVHCVVEETLINNPTQITIKKDNGEVKVS